MEKKIKSLIKKLSRLGFSVEQKNTKHTDPVCGMKTSSDMFTTEHKGTSYYFCSEHCQKQFVANPNNYTE